MTVVDHVLHGLLAVQGLVLVQLHLGLADDAFSTFSPALVELIASRPSPSRPASLLLSLCRSAACISSFSLSLSMQIDDEETERALRFCRIDYDPGECSAVVKLYDAGIVRDCFGRMQDAATNCMRLASIPMLQKQKNLGFR
jgi:hypothetical protein